MKITQALLAVILFVLLLAYFPEFTWKAVALIAAIWATLFCAFWLFIGFRIVSSILLFPILWSIAAIANFFAELPASAMSFIELLNLRRKNRVQSDFQNNDLKSDRTPNLDSS